MVDYRVRELNRDDDLDMSVQHLGGWTITSLGGTTPPEETVHLGEVRAPSYWQQCLTYARSNMTLGETRQALLWANMAVEALLDQRLEQLASEAGNEDILAQLQGGRLVFRQAEEILSEQYPEMAGKVNWPDRQMQLSRLHN
jgi:hypothetical protein